MTRKKFNRVTILTLSKRKPAINLEMMMKIVLKTVT